MAKGQNEEQSREEETQTRQEQEKSRAGGVAVYAGLAYTEKTRNYPDLSRHRPRRVRSAWLAPEAAQIRYAPKWDTC